jgi:hypothetical protein
MTCGHSKPSDGTKVVDLDLVIGYDPAHISFQHDMITGISHAAVFGDYLLESPKTRGILCQKNVCEIMKAAFNPQNVLDRANLPKLFWARSIRYSRAPGDTSMDGCEPFPFGSFWPVELFLKGLATLRKAKTPTILYLARGGPGPHAMRFLDNEAELVAAFEAFAKDQEWVFEVVPHQITGVSEFSTDSVKIAKFYAANAIVGLHGGAFSNIVYCNSQAVVVEINNNVKARECFSSISVARGLKYVRFQYQRIFQYQNWDHFVLDPREIRQLIAIVKVNVLQKLKVV